MQVQLLNAVELRVLGCLIEKQRTTPEQYPLTLNALRLACNQSTNRDPVTTYDEETVRAAAQSLGTRGYARLATGPGSRTPKYRQLFAEALDLMPAEVSILAVLMLRGPQTAAELKARTARLHAMADVSPVLETLAEKELVHRVPRQPGTREDRFAHLLGDAPAEEPGDVQVEAAASLERRLSELEARVAGLERMLAARAPLA
ncbi:MAG TPA: YceH family protein [Gaiellaceae bacterium]